MNHKKENSKVVVENVAPTVTDFEVAESPSAFDGKENGKHKKRNGKNGHAAVLEDHPSSILNGNSMVADRELLKVLTEVKNGNFSVRMPIDEVGLSGKICDTLNE